MCPPYSQRDRKRRLNGAVCRNHRIKRVVPCRCLDGLVPYIHLARNERGRMYGTRTGTLKNPTKCLWRWEPDRRSNFFFSPPAHLCAVTYMTEISLIVTLNNQFNSTQLKTNVLLIAQLLPVTRRLILVLVSLGISTTWRVPLLSPCDRGHM